MKIFVAIPVYDGKLGVQSVNCLINESRLANSNGDDLTVNFLSSDSGIAGARNTLAKEFMASDFDRLVFLDSDVTFEPGELIKLAYMPVDFVGAVYRHKMEKESYPLNFLPSGQIPLTRCGLIEVLSVPTGFLALSRKVFETIKEKYPDRKYSHMGQSAHVYFQIAFIDGVFYSEDFLFCKEWIELGGKIYVQPEVTLKHWDYLPKAFTGNLGNWIKSQNNQPKELSNELPAIQISQDPSASASLQ